MPGEPGAGPGASAAPGGTAAAGWAVLIACWSLVALIGLIWAAASRRRGDHRGPDGTVRHEIRR